MAAGGIQCSKFPQKGAIFQTFQSHIVSPKTGPKGGIIYHDRHDLPIWAEIKKTIP